MAFMSHDSLFIFEILSFSSKSTLAKIDTLTIN